MRHKLFIQLVIYNFYIFSKRNLFSKNLKVVTKPVRRQTTLKNRIYLNLLFIIIFSSYPACHSLIADLMKQSGIKDLQRDTDIHLVCM